MKCPICGETLKPGKKDPNYLLCYNCKKKFKAPQKKAAPKEKEEQKYGNIPPKEVREKREREMRKAYDELLSVEDEKPRKKKAGARSNAKANTKAKTRRREELDDDYYDYDYDDDEKVSKLPVIILGIAILVVAGVIIFMLLK